MRKRHLARFRPKRALITVALAMSSVCLMASPAALAGTAGTVKTSAHTTSKHHSVAKKATRARKITRRVRTIRYAALPPSIGQRLGLRNTPDELALQSSAVLVIDQDSGEILVNKNADAVLPIASLTKLMTALVVTSAHQPMDEILQISADDIDTEKNTRSRLIVGTRLSRSDMLLLALMSSENRAASALSRSYPGGREGFVAQMNAKARALGMASTHFADPAGLSNQSVSTARDLHKLVNAAYAQPLIREYSTQSEHQVRVGRRMVTFNSSNRLVRTAGDWDIELQKTGFTNEAGRCLVMRAKVFSRRLAMIFLDSTGTLTRYADAARVRKQLEREAKTLSQELGGTHAVGLSPS